MQQLLICCVWLELGEYCNNSIHKKKLPPNKGYYYATQAELKPGSHELRHSNYCSNSKSYYEIFSTTTLDYWKNYHDSFGVTHAQYELRGLLWFRFGGADSIENDDDIGLSEHLS